MHFEDHNWMHIEDYLKKDDRVILVLGACEQHGYLSLQTDVKIPMALADAATEQSGVPVAPPLNFGCAPFFLDYPGTISLRLHTYLDLVEDILRSLYGSGFRRVLILNGHGGNIPVKIHLVELLNELTDLQLRWYEWWTTGSVEQIAKKYDLVADHANWLEAFDFNIVADLPAESKPLPLPNDEILSKAASRKAFGDGAFGGAYQVDPAIMDEMFAACLDDVLKQLNFD
jgi:creatinine amidohydrolase